MGGELKSSVTERLNKGLMSVSSPTVRFPLQRSALTRFDGAALKPFGRSEPPISSSRPIRAVGWTRRGAAGGPGGAGGGAAAHIK
eukprot:1186382-Prorocentrum_minimum.AAC.4